MRGVGCAVCVCLLLVRLLCSVFGVCRSSVQAHHKQQEGKKKKGARNATRTLKPKNIVTLFDVVIVAAVVSPLATQSLLSSAFHQREKGR